MLTSRMLHTRLMMTSSVARDDGVNKEATWRARFVWPGGRRVDGQLDTVARDDGVIRRRSPPASCPSMTPPLGKMITSQTRMLLNHKHELYVFFLTLYSPRSTTYFINVAINIYVNINENNIKSENTSIRPITLSTPQW